MPKLTPIMASAAIFLTFGHASLAQDADTVVATVGDHEITLGEMILTRTRLPAQYQQFPPDVLFGGILDQLIQQQLLASTVEEPSRRVTLSLRNEERTLMAGQAIDQLSAEQVTEAAIQEAYNARFAGAEPGTEYNASHLLVETEEEALAAKARVDGGEEFADVAREVSTGPSGPNGGNLGWFGDGQMVPAFEAAVKELEIGNVSMPVETQFGWHVVKLNDTRLIEQPGLEDMRSQLYAEVQEAAVLERVNTLREQVTIVMPEAGDFDPLLIENTDLLRAGE